MYALTRINSLTYAFAAIDLKSKTADLCEVERNT